MPGRKRLFVKQQQNPVNSSGNSRNLRRVSDGRVAAKRMKNEQLDDTGRYRIDAECDTLSEFVRTGRTGRRNALPATADSHTLSDDPVSYVQVSDLPDTLARMSCGNTKSSNNSNNTPNKGISESAVFSDQPRISDATSSSSGFHGLASLCSSSSTSSSSSSLEPPEQRQRNLVTINSDQALPVANNTSKWAFPQAGCLPEEDEEEDL